MSTSTSISELAGFATDGLLDERLRVLAPVAVADYTFVSYVRSGLGAAIVAELHEDDPLTTTIDVSLTLWANAGPNGTQLASHSAVVYGPGDVIGFDAAQVIRRYPAPGGAEANPNDLAMVEFDTPELPWLFTPAAPSADGRHTPWIGLVCVEDPFGMRLLSAGRRGNPSLWLDGNEQPDLGDAWAWAHAQVLGTPEGPAIVEQLGRGNRVANLSRLICPRRLRPNTSYLAAIVPLFEAGRQAGLGQPVEEAHKHRAWHCTASVEVPVYDSFSFRTGEAADLEALARRIVGTKATAGVGRLRLDVHSPSETITVPAESAQVHILEGPLLGTTPSDGSRYPATQQTQLTDALGRTSEATLRPPTYGAAHLALPELPDKGGPAWLEELNLEPAARVIAGLGARVVMMDQEEIMAAAWEQLGDLAETNRTARLTQFADFASSSLRERHFAPMSHARQLAITAPVHAKVVGATSAAEPVSTVSHRIASSSLAPSTLSVGFRRLTRPTGPALRSVASGALDGIAAARRVSDALVVATGATSRDWVQKLADADGVTSLCQASRQLVAPSDVAGSQAIAASLAERSLIERLDAATVDELANAIATNADFLANARGGIVEHLLAQLPKSGVFADADDNIVASSVASALNQFGQLISHEPDGGLANVSLSSLRRFGLDTDNDDAGKTFVGLSGQALSERMKALGNQVANSPVPVDVNVVDQLTALLSKQLQSVWLAPSADEYRTTFTQALAGVPSIGTPDEPKRMPVDNVELDILKWIHPTRTLTSRLLGRLGTVPETLANVPGWFESRRLEPLMWEPNLPAPLWEALDRLDRRWLLPGLERVTPSDVATALVTNERFIEAFLLGANHELGREFLWRGFPTDQRGTALKCFWSRFDELSSGIRDFADGALGSHANGSGIGVVALFRGELIRRFGDTLLFFALKQTDISTTGRPRPVFDEDQQLDAEFVHTVGDNVALAGFKLEPDRALSENWWFVVAEHVAEPRFGLDAEREPGLTNVGPVERDDASWSDFDTEPGAFLKVADISKHLAANTAADVAYALFQQPVRAVYPAAELLGDGNA